MQLRTDRQKKVILVGGPDVDKRIDLMHYLRNEFQILAVGSNLALKEKFDQANFPYLYYNLARGINLFSDTLTIIQLVRIFRQEQPDIVHTFGTKPSVLARLAAFLADVPVIIGTLSGLGSLYTKQSIFIRIIRQFYQNLQKLSCNLSDLTIFQNYADMQQFIESRIVSLNKIDVILGSGVSTDSFIAEQVSAEKRLKLKQELKIIPDHIVVTMISRVIHSKGVFDFSKAAQNIRKNHQDVEFILVGSTDEESLDRLRADELKKLQQLIIWTGLRKDISTILAISDIFVLPSAYREGIPRVLLEAASMSLPIVTTDSPGCNEVVEDGVNGFLVPVHDVSALTEAIQHLIDHPELRREFGKASRQRAVNRFDLSIVAERTCVIYKQLLETKRPMHGGD